MLVWPDQQIETKEEGDGKGKKHPRPSGLLQQLEMPKILARWKSIARIYIDEIVAGNGVPMSIISNRDGRFTSRALANITESLKDAIGYEYSLSSSDGWIKVSCTIQHKKRIS
ncbi:hypothetical protein Tco_0462322 [Tanacetum coccineum]